MQGVIKLKEDSSRPKIKLMGPKTKKRWDLVGKKGGKRMQRFVCYLFMFYYYLSISNGIRLQTFFKNSKFSLQNVDLRGRVGRPSLYLSQVWSTRVSHFCREPKIKNSKYVEMQKQMSLSFLIRQRFSSCHCESDITC